MKGRTPATVLGVGRRGGLAGPCEKKMPPRPSFDPVTPPSPPSAPSHPGTRREMVADARAARLRTWNTGQGREHPSFPLEGQDLPAAAPPPGGTAGWAAGKGGGTACQEHFQTHTARVPPKYR